MGQHREWHERVTGLESCVRLFNFNRKFSHISKLQAKFVFFLFHFLSIARSTAWTDTVPAFAFVSILNAKNYAISWKCGERRTNKIFYVWVNGMPTISSGNTHKCQYHREERRRMAQNWYGKIEAKNGTKSLTTMHNRSLSLKYWRENPMFVVDRRRRRRWRRRRLRHRRRDCEYV